MISGVTKIEELDGKSLVKKADMDTLKGRLYILQPADSEIAKHLEITEQGVFAVRLR